MRRPVSPPQDAFAAPLCCSSSVKSEALNSRDIHKSKKPSNATTELGEHDHIRDQSLSPPQSRRRHTSAGVVGCTTHKRPLEHCGYFRRKRNHRGKRNDQTGSSRKPTQYRNPADKERNAVLTSPENRICRPVDITEIIMFMLESMMSTLAAFNREKHVLHAFVSKIFGRASYLTPHASRPDGVRLLRMVVVPTPTPPSFLSVCELDAQTLLHSCVRHTVSRSRGHLTSITSILS